MLFVGLASLLLAGVALAQTPPDYTPAVTAHLEVKFGSKSLVPGTALTKAGKSNQSNKSISSDKYKRHRQSTNNRYDRRGIEWNIHLSHACQSAPLRSSLPRLLYSQLHSPPSATGGAAGTRGTVLHALITGYKSATTETNGLYVLSTTDTGPSTFFAPAPPAETPAHPHKYIEFLIPQPAGFKVPSSQTSSISKRLGFNITAFLKDANCDAPVRANYFTQVAA
ncbi:hypothetical protein G7Y89_g4825 [Cudoniella acicularis]|uniref:PEBP-like protein n=1 Tax=Cudoniella acicularis TaxID=354080 RepID=A0A8H4RQ44_9HELO|nr:hypothetical protein G7Y89_g4825 [Cudoniella acicularis]